MTIEAALLLPLFLFFFLHLGGVMEMLRLHGKIEAALWNAGNQLVLYTSVSPQVSEKLPDMEVSYFLVNQQVQACLGKEYLEESPLVYGAAGLNYLRSDYRNEEECVDIFVTYQVEPILTLFPFGYRRMANRYYARSWTGYAVSDEIQPLQYVYMTPHGEVYHKIPRCSYIFHEVKRFSVNLIGKKKNVEGRIYEPCDFCGDDVDKTYVYVTLGGEKYHYDQKCGAIFKEVAAVEWDEGQQFRPCSRCAQEGEK